MLPPCTCANKCSIHEERAVKKEEQECLDTFSFTLRAGTAGTAETADRVANVAIDIQLPLVKKMVLILSWILRVEFEKRRGNGSLSIRLCVSTTITTVLQTVAYIYYVLSNCCG